MEYIITFKNTNSAIKAEQCLMENKLQVGVAPLPSQIKAGCGICLRVKYYEIKQALKILEDKDIEGIGLFFRRTVNGSFFYTAVKDTEYYTRSE